MATSAQRGQMVRVRIGRKITPFYPHSGEMANNQSLKDFSVTYRYLNCFDMNRPLQLQKRFQIGAVLLVLLVGIVWNNVSSKRNLEKVDTSVTSIYNDRLMAATYIFDLSNILYEKAALGHTAAARQQAALDRSIADLIHKYDNTMLTVKEAALWRSFKDNLRQYNIADAHSETVFFNKAIGDLKALSALQATEGNSLFRKTQSSITAFALSSNLEMALAVGLGIITLVLIGASKDAMLNLRQRPSLN